MQPDTRKILRAGVLIFLTGAACAALTTWVFGGISREGPHTNAGWLALIVAIGCLPTGSLTLLLGLLKFFGDRRR